MTAGVSVDSWVDQCTVTASGTWDADYPASNLTDVWRSSMVGRVNGGTTLSFDRFGGFDIEFVAIVNHDFQPGDTLRVQAGIFDTGVIDFWPGAYVPGYRAVRPVKLPGLTYTTNVTITISASGDHEIGAVELARFWEWPGISPGAEVGVRVPAPATSYAGGGSRTYDGVLPRTYNGQLDRYAMTKAARHGLEFQALKGTAQPFVFVENYEDPDSWARTCFLARNTELPPSVGAVYRHDTVQLRLTEWLR